MTFEEVKKIRENPTMADVDNEELHKLIDIALEKQIPKKPISKVLANEGYAWQWTCPNCHIEKISTENAYCSDCGHALDWGEEK